MYAVLLTLSLLSSSHVLHAEVGDKDLNETSEKQYAVKINKCCLENELIVNGVCRSLKQYNQTAWVPEFKTEDGNNTEVKLHTYITGFPNCETTYGVSIFDVGKSEDELSLLSDGRLRHIIHHESADIIEEDRLISPFSTHGNTETPNFMEPTVFIHQQNKYCMDKLLISSKTIGSYAAVCVPDLKENSTENSTVIVHQ